MKTKTRPHKAKSKKGKGLKGAGAEKLKAAKKGMGEEVAKPIGFIVGLAGASFVGNLIDKVPFLVPKEGAEKTIVQKLAKPIALAAVGGVTVYLTHGKKETAQQFANGAGWGFVAGGTFSGAKAFMKSDPFKGLGQSPSENKAALEAKYYKEQAADMAKLLEQNKFQPELPAASEAANGMAGENVPSELKYENTSTIV